MIRNWIVRPLLWVIPMMILAAALGIELKWQLWVWGAAGAILDGAVNALVPERAR